MDAEPDPDVSDADNTEPLPIPTLGGYAVRPSREVADLQARASAPPPTPTPPPGPAPHPGPTSPPTVLPPFDFSALNMKRTPSRGRRWALALGAVGAVAALVAVTAVTVTSPEEASQAPAEAAPEVAEDARDPEAEERLAKLVPASYPTDTCAAVAPPADALAQLSCRAGADPVERPAARYTLAADRDTMIAMFDRLVTASNAVVCPGRIQSPGPWRRNATPHLVSGTVFCGLKGKDAVVGWTDESTLVISEIRSTAGQTGLDQLFTWWSANS